MRNSKNIKYVIIGEFDEAFIEFIEKQIDSKLEAHDSLYKGDYWLFRDETLELNIELRINIDPMHDPESDPEEEYYFDYENSDCALLLDIDGGQAAVRDLSLKLAKNSSFRHISDENYTW